MVQPVEPCAACETGNVLAVAPDIAEEFENSFLCDWCSESQDFRNVRFCGAESTRRKFDAEEIHSVVEEFAFLLIDADAPFGESLEDFAYVSHMSLH